MASENELQAREQLVRRAFNLSDGYNLIFTEKERIVLPETDEVIELKRCVYGSHVFDAGYAPKARVLAVRR